ncbi:MAG: hypothetical protein P1P87_15785, partial [Trueperaceae bacterium]|nr:hypothetical protein [Trueperaceae bacterium]
LADKHANQGGIFIRLAANGDKVVGAFCGEPFAREVVWTGERYETYDPAVHTDKRPSLRVMLNFFVPDEGDMKVIEGGTVWFKDVLKVRDKYGLDKWLFEIERHGDAGDPKTTYSILPEEKIDDELRGQIAGAELHDLAALSSGDANADKGGDKPASKPSSGGPIDPRDASQLVGRLKQLPRSDVDAFLAEFGVKRVRDLKASDVAKAKQALDRLEAAMRAEDDEDDSIDPFA